MAPTVKRVHRSPRSIALGVAQRRRASRYRSSRPTRRVSLRPGLALLDWPQRRSAPHQDRPPRPKLGQTQQGRQEPSDSGPPPARAALIFRACQLLSQRLVAPRLAFSSTHTHHHHRQVATNPRFCSCSALEHRHAAWHIMRVLQPPSPAYQTPL